MDAEHGSRSSPLAADIASKEDALAIIHPTAFVDSQAKLAGDVNVGPFCVIEADVEIGAGCKLEARSSVKNGTILGECNTIGEGAIIGGRPQHLRAGEELGRLIIGRGNHIRENATIHRGIKPGCDTIIGNENYMMVNVHIAHDCHIGSNTIIANNAMLSGHITVEDRAYISGAVGIHQFCRVGSLAMVGGQAHITRDVPPFVTVDGPSSLIVGLNSIGLRRSGMSKDELASLKEAYRVIYRSGAPWSEILAILESQFTVGPAAKFLSFFTSGKRGFTPARSGGLATTLKLVESADADNTSEAAELRKAG
jgi:UDP-N-acetylglucosamine acyltransferase